MSENEKKEKLKDYLCENGFSESILFNEPSYIDAIVGISGTGALIYDYDKMAEYLMQQEDCEFNDIAEAYAFIDYNNSFSIDIEGIKPIILHKIIG